MKLCPFCKEQIAEEAIKCRYCQSMLLPGLASPSVSDASIKGKVTYVLDEGLVSFATFSVAVLGVFVLVGTYLFGIKLEVTVDKMQEAQLTLEKSDSELERLKSTAADVRKEVEQATVQTQSLLGEIERNRQASILIVAEMRTRFLTPSQSEHLAEVRKNSPERFRDNSGTSKLWTNGSTLRIHFMDGTTEQREKFGKALDEWLKYANLRATYIDSNDAPIQVSFAQEGSWSMIGVDALGIVGGSSPTINLGFQGGGADIPTNYLHEIGHLLGLVHEFNNPNAHLNWNREAVYSAFSGPPNYWAKSLIDSTFFQSAPYPGVREFDRSSIMIYAMPSAFFKDGTSIVAPSGLSESDKKFVASLYPKT
jgi:serralysin